MLGLLAFPFIWRWGSLTMYTSGEGSSHELELSGLRVGSSRWFRAE